MARRKLTDVVRYLRHLVNPAKSSGLSDAELLERYVRHRDEAAFELLLWRHGVLVFNVCRRILPREQDAEDAFQATFLAFVRKAHAIARRGSVSSWLYKVAYRVALEARERARKTAAHEKPGGEILAVHFSPDPVWSDLRPILDEELSRLPERLRRPLILCHLEGKSNEEAARELGCRLGTIYSRLSRGREMLRKRLLRRGVSLSVAALTAALAAHAAEAAPITHVVRVAVGAARSFAGLPMGGPISPRATALAEGVLRTMFVAKLKIVALLVFVAGAVAAGGVLSHTLTAAPQEEAKAEDPAPKKEVADKPDAKPIAVKVVKPTPGGLARTVERPAQVEASQQQQIVPLISGTVKEVAVDIGDRVKKGQTLIVLDAPLLAKELEQASAAMEMAKAQAEEAEAQVHIAEAEVASSKVILQQLMIVRETASSRDRTVAETNVKVKQAKLAQVKASLMAAKANARMAQVAMDKARIQESFTQIKAAFDGVVIRRTADVGNFVQASDSRLLTPLLTLQPADRLRVVVQVPAQDAPFVGRGDPVDLTLGAFPGVRLSAQKIARFSPTLNASNRTMTVEIDVPNPDGRLMPGMDGTITIHFKKRLTTALVVPRSCLLLGHPVREPSYANAVYIVRDGKAHATRVKVAAEDGKNAEIIEGVKEADLIVTDPKNLKGEIVPVEIKKEP
jgi:RND family efflux transporter MFP subunit